MLVTIGHGEKRGWFHYKSHERYIKEFGKNVPPKFVIGPDTVSYVMLLNGSDRIFKPGEVYMYLGREKFFRKNGEKIHLRVFLVDGRLGFIEGNHVKYLEPL